MEWQSMMERSTPNMSYQAWRHEPEVDSDWHTWKIILNVLIWCILVFFESSVNKKNIGYVFKSWRNLLMIKGMLNLFICLFIIFLFSFSLQSSVDLCVLHAWLAFSEMFLYAGTTHSGIIWKAWCLFLIEIIGLLVWQKVYVWVNLWGSMMPEKLGASVPTLLHLFVSCLIILSHV